VKRYWKKPKEKFRAASNIGHNTQWIKANKTKPEHRQLKRWATRNP